MLWTLLQPKERLLESVMMRPEMVPAVLFILCNATRQDADTFRKLVKPYMEAQCAAVEDARIASLSGEAAAARPSGSTELGNPPVPGTLRRTVSSAATALLQARDLLIALLKLCLDDGKASIMSCIVDSLNKLSCQFAPGELLASRNAAPSHWHSSGSRRVWQKHDWLVG